MPNSEDVGALKARIAALEESEINLIQCSTELILQNLDKTKKIVRLSEELEAQKMKTESLECEVEYMSLTWKARSEHSGYDTSGAQDTLTFTLLKSEDHQQVQNIQGLQYLHLTSHPKRTFDDFSNHDSPSPFAICIQCYMHDRTCDIGEPCQSCIDHGTTCKRAECTNFKAGTCSRAKCSRVHEDDVAHYDYKKVVNAGHVSKKPENKNRVRKQKLKGGRPGPGGGI